MSRPRKNLSKSLKESIAGKQSYRCANKPGKKLKGLENYECPLWKNTKDCGSFDENGYEIDHKVEHCLTADDSESNLQALCACCHGVKTKRFLRSERNPRKKNIRKFDDTDSSQDECDSSQDESHSSQHESDSSQDEQPILDIDKENRLMRITQAQREIEINEYVTSDEDDTNNCENVISDDDDNVINEDKPVIIISTENKHVCQCGQTFTRTYTLKRHKLESCPLIKNNQNDNNIPKNDVINIFIPKSLNEEGIDDLTLSEWCDILKLSDNVFLEILSKVNCTKKLHHNILYSSPSKAYCYVYIDNKVKCEQFVDIIDLYIDNRSRDIKKVIKMIGAAFDKKRIKTITKYIEKLQTDTSEKKKFIRRAKIILLNNSVQIKSVLKPINAIQK